MPSAPKIHQEPYTVDFFLSGKSEQTVALYQAFVLALKGVAPQIEIIPAKTMIGVATPRKRIAWITQFGRNFLHVIFPFAEPHEDNLCFMKIAQVPDDNKQFNHHLRIFNIEDINDEVLYYMKLALQQGS